MSYLIKLPAVLAITLLVVCFGGITGCSIQSDSAQVNAAATKIAEFTLPPGYTPEATAELGGYLYVSYAPGDGHSHIQFVQAPATANVDRAQLEEYIRQASQNRSYDRGIRSKVVGQIQATIRGQAVTLAQGEGVNSDGQAYRTITGVFQGKGGPTLLSVESPTRSWNQEAVDRFIASIR